MVFWDAPNVDEVFTEGSKKAHYWESWLSLLASSDPEITEALAASPFVLLLDPRTGKRLWKGNKRVLRLRPELRTILRDSRHTTEKPSIPHEQFSYAPMAEKLDWEVLPPRWWRNPSLVRKVLGHDEITPQDTLLISRLQFVDGLQPTECYSSKPSLSSRFGDRTYFVFIFDNHVVAECPKWGNAIYVIKGTKDWQVLLKHSKREVLDLARGRVTRILHSGEWKARLCFALNKALPTELFSTPEHT